MPIIEDKIKKDEQLKEQIDERIGAEHFRPTDSETLAAQQVIRLISEKYAKELSEADTDQLREEISKTAREECQKLQVSYEAQKRIEKVVLQTAIGHGPIEEYLQDPSVTEIIVQRYDNIVIERNGKIEETDATFSNEFHLQTVINRIVQRVNRQINLTSPIVDARLADGSRVNATIPPVSPDGATLTIRKFAKSGLSGRDYVMMGSMSASMLYFLERCVKGKISIFVSGGTGSGKTTMLNMLSAYIPNDELIVTIEDTLELQLQQKNVRRMEVRDAGNAKDMMNVDQKTLVKAALRQRPDRIILGETRDGSVVDLISAMSTGHEGSMSPIHANSPQNMCNSRMLILYSMNPEANFSERAVALQISEALQVIVQVARFPDGSRKVEQISYVTGLTKDGLVDIKDIFYYDKIEKKFKFTGFIPDDIRKAMRERGLDFNEDAFKR